MCAAYGCCFLLTTEPQGLLLSLITTITALKRAGRLRSFSHRQKVKIQPVALRREFVQSSVRETFMWAAPSAQHDLQQPFEITDISHSKLF